MSNQHIQKQIEKADKIYMQDSTPGFKDFNYVQGYKRGVKEMRELFIEALDTVWKDAVKEATDVIFKNLILELEKARNQDSERDISFAIGLVKGFRDFKAKDILKQTT